MYAYPTWLLAMWYASSSICFLRSDWLLLVDWRALIGQWLSQHAMWLVERPRPPRPTSGRWADWVRGRSLREGLHSVGLFYPHVREELEKRERDDWPVEPHTFLHTHYVTTSQLRKPSPLSKSIRRRTAWQIRRSKSPTLWPILIHWKSMCRSRSLFPLFFIIYSMKLARLSLE